MLAIMKGFIVSASLLMSFSAFANYLYWQVNDTDDGIGSLSYDGARVYAVSGSGGEATLIDIWQYSGSDDLFSEFKQVGMAAHGNGGTQEAYANLSELGGIDGYSFFIELVNYDESTLSYTQVAKSEMTSYADLSSHVTGDMDVNPSATVPWHGTGFSGAVPEPTSGALLLLGAGIAAFKKRRNLKDLLKRKA